jgi:hypothetical protein
MSATYILQSGSASVMGVTLSSVTSIEVNETGKVTELSTDGSRNVNAVFVDGKTVTITINTSDASGLKAAGLRVGKTGSCTVVGKLRSAGSDMAATTLTITIGEAAVTNITASIPTEATGSGSITVQAYDSSGDDSLVSWS